ncbi:15959_t:CDS:2, partial [Cetraspora pellucida]
MYSWCYSMHCSGSFIESEYSSATDVHSFGVIMMESVTDKRPFDAIVGFKPNLYKWQSYKDLDKKNKFLAAD